MRPGLRLASSWRCSPAVHLVGIALLACSTVLACKQKASPESGVLARGGDAVQTYLGQPVDVVDIHMHPGKFEEMGPIGQNFIRSVLPGFLPRAIKDASLSVAAGLMLNPYGAFIGIKRQCEAARLSHCGLFSTYAPETWGITTNETIMGYLDDGRNRGANGEPYFFGLASVFVQDWKANEAERLASLRKALQHPLMKGIKLAFIHNNIPLDDPQYDSIYALADELKVPVYHHVGSSPLRGLKDFTGDTEKQNYIASYDPRRLERAIKAFPQVTFIMGHMGFDFNKEGYDFGPEVYDLAAKYPNIVLEISAFGRATYDPDGKVMDLALTSIKSKGLIGRAIYGSDGPGSPGGTQKYIEATLRSLERVQYTIDEARAILGGNATQLYHLAP